MSDPFVASIDTDIPTPTRDDLLRLVHAENRDQLAAGTLPAKVAETLWADARRQWDEGHKAEATRKANEAGPNITDKPAGDEKAVPGARTSPRATGIQQRTNSQLLAFMSPQVRAAYDAADREQKQILLEATRRAFEEAEKRKEQRRRRELDLTAKALDMLQRIKEDPDKAHLLPPADASMQDLHEWYKEMSKPVRTVPFPGSIDTGAGARQSSHPDYGNPTPSQIRQDRIWRARQSGEKPDPDDIAEEEAEAERYQRKLAEARERRFKEVEAEFAPKPIGPPVPSAVQQVENGTDKSERFSKTALEKFDKLAERNSFMGGGVGLAIAAYAFLLGGAPRFGFALLVVSWFVIAVSVWRHRFFENRKHENTWNVVICGLIGILLFWIWILLV